MFYVAKKYSSITPAIVEQFQSRSLAKKYADVMNEAGKGEFVVLALLNNNNEEEGNNQ